MINHFAKFVCIQILILINNQKYACICLHVRTYYFFIIKKKTIKIILFLQTSCEFPKKTLTIVFNPNT